MGPTKLVKVKKHWEQLERLGFIQPSASPLLIPILLLNKSDESKRLCIEYRELNRGMTKNKYLMLQVDICLIRCLSVKSDLSILMKLNFSNQEKEKEKGQKKITKEESIKLCFTLFNTELFLNVYETRSYMSLTFHTPNHRWWIVERDGQLLLGREDKTCTSK